MDHALANIYWHDCDYDITFYKGRVIRKLLISEPSLELRMVMWLYTVNDS